MAEKQNALWIFAYGSLMWRPDFPFRERHRAELFGYHRSLCIQSHLYRGTVEKPGLVFGLDRGGSCVGVAFLIEPEHVAPTLEAVRLRELVLGVYQEIEAPVLLSDGRTVTALAYAADHGHPQYAGQVPFDEVVRIVGERRGASGTNLDYVRNTQAHLLDLGVDDPTLTALCAALEPLHEPDHP